MSDYKRALGPEGIHIVVGGSMARVFQLLLLRPWLSMSEGKKMVVLAHDPNKDLAFLAELLEAGKVVPVIDGRYALDEVPEALRQIGEGNVRGKSVISMSETSR
jgi:D-arabinose 1-dehydrogenase-like Zn-dependent alcohol dehydrogenase